MTFAASVARNTMIQIAGKVAGTVLGFAVVVILTRYLNPEGFGQYTTVMAYLGFFSVVADLGLYLVVVREINTEGADRAKVIGNILSIRALSAVTLLLLGAILTVFFPYPPIVREAIRLGTLSFFFVALNQLFVGLFQTHLVMHRVVAGELLGRVVLLGGVVLLTRAGAGLLAIIGAVIVGSVTNFLVTFWFARRLSPIRFRFEWPYWRRVLRITFPLALSVILNLIYFRIDTIFLSLFRSQEVVGLYGAAYKVLEILVTFPNMFVGLVLPVLAATAFTDRSRFITVFQRSFEVLILGALPILVGGWFVAQPLMHLVGGAAFAGAAPFFRILLIATAFLYLGALSGHTIVAIHKQGKMVWGYLTVAVLGVVAYLLLIPRFGATGAAIGTVLTEGTIFGIGLAMILRTVRFRLGFGVFGKAIVGCAVMGVGLFLVRSTPLLLQVAVGAILYLGTLVLVRGIPLQLVRELLTLRRGATQEEIGPPA